MNTIYLMVACVVVLAGGVKWLTSKAATEGKLKNENQQLRSANELRGQIDKVDASRLTAVQLNSLL